MVACIILLNLFGADTKTITDHIEIVACTILLNSFGADTKTLQIILKWSPVLFG
jgi:hypothetical protein